MSIIYIGLKESPLVTGGRDRRLSASFARRMGNLWRVLSGAKRPGQFDVENCRARTRWHERTVARWIYKRRIRMRAPL